MYRSCNLGATNYDKQASVSEKIGALDRRSVTSSDDGNIVLNAKK